MLLKGQAQSTFKMQILLEVTSLRMKLLTVEHFFHHFWVGATATAQSFIRKVVTSYKIHTLVSGVFL
jgi:hypothetical protein